MTARIKARRFESTQEPLDDEERVLMDPETWDWDSAYVIEPCPESGVIQQVSLSGDELTIIEQAATKRGMTVNAFLRSAALRCASNSTST